MREPLKGLLATHAVLLTLSTHPHIPVNLLSRRHQRLGHV